MTTLDFGNIGAPGPETWYFFAGSYDENTSSRQYTLPSGTYYIGGTSGYTSGLTIAFGNGAMSGYVIDGNSGDNNISCPITIKLSGVSSNISGNTLTIQNITFSGPVVIDTGSTTPGSTNTLTLNNVVFNDTVTINNGSTVTTANTLNISGTTSFGDITTINAGRQSIANTNILNMYGNRNRWHKSRKWCNSKYGYFWKFIINECV